MQITISKRMLKQLREDAVLHDKAEIEEILRELEELRIDTTVLREAIEEPLTPLPQV